MNESYRQGFRDGYETAIGGRAPVTDEFFEDLSRITMGKGLSKPKRKVRQTPKQKLLTQMTKKKWDKYKKGSGKKTYVQIRAQVSRSMEFKKKAKRL
jgi:nucleoid-associated protein YgaU